MASPLSATSPHTPSQPLPTPQQPPVNSSQPN